jgi:hypothetical protein
MEELSREVDLEAQGGDNVRAREDLGRLDEPAETLK